MSFNHQIMYWTYIQRTFATIWPVCLQYRQTLWAQIITEIDYVEVSDSF